MQDVDTSHRDIHSEEGARRDEHAGRAANPTIKVTGLAWLEFEKPDLAAAERFAHAFGFGTVLRTGSELHLRGTEPGGACVIIRRGPRSRFVGHTFAAPSVRDVERLADRFGVSSRPLHESMGGTGVDLRDPSGAQVRVVAGVRDLPALPSQSVHTLNQGGAANRTNATQRPPRAPAQVRRLGHVVLQTPRFIETLDWYLEHLGLIVSDFLYYEGQRERGPTMAFIRCDNGTTPTDHHTLAMMLGPSNRYVHSAYEVTDLDALAAGGEHLLDEGYQRSWGIGRHIQGSQIFDYWRDPDGFLVEHYSDGDLFDCTLDPGWAPMTASGLAQWGPPATADFLGTPPSRESLTEFTAVLRALREDNEFDRERLAGLLRVVRS